VQVTLAVVSSLNGKITKGGDAPAHSWTSPEDWEEFQRLRDSCDVVILDSKTYGQMDIKPSPKLLRIVLTRRPKEYRIKAIPGQLEFTDSEPAALIQKLQAEGHRRVLLAGGRRTSYAFLEAGLVDDFYLTLEPQLFGDGKAMLADGPLDLSLQLLETEQLNARGTMLLHYRVER
jgi:dihydrofolate reductase